MAKAGSTISAAILLLLTGTAARSQDAQSEPGGASLSGAAVASASPSLEIPGSAQRPSYAPGGWRCPPGYVWRNAGKTDWLCVAPDEADLIELENEQAPANWIEAPGGGRACREGLVERQAFKGDIACVEPERRAAIEQMNLALYTVR